MDIKGKEFIKKVLEVTQGLDTKMMYVRDYNGVPEVISSTEDSRVNVFIKAKSPMSGLTPDFGLSNLAILQGIIKLDSYMTDDSTLNLIVKGDEVGGIEFKDSNKKIKYQVPDIAMNFFQGLKKLTTYHDKVIDWTVTVEDIKMETVKEFNQMNAILAGITSSFYIKTVDGDLKFYIGDDTQSNHCADITVANNVAGTIDTPIYYNSKSFTTVLNKIQNRTNNKMSVYDRGSIELYMEDEVAEYKFVFLGSQQEN